MPLSRYFLGATPALALALFCSSGSAADFQLAMPVKCNLGETCFVQNYVDIDPGPRAMDILCGQASYDGHKGTDFRVLNTEVTADVVAAAAGVVRGLRNSVPDHLMQTPEDQQRVQNVECGNGVVIDHGGGWETQYCHLRQGTVLVTSGESVEAGQKLGEVGYSGAAAFAHLHLSVRKDGREVDPFLGDTLIRDRLSACRSGSAAPIDTPGLWKGDAAALLRDADGSLIQLGFSAGPVSPAAIERAVPQTPDASSPALVFFARAINLRRGDRVALSVTGPGDFAVSSDGEPLDRTKAQWVAYTGRKLRLSRWPSGTYKGEAIVFRNGKRFVSGTYELVLGE